MNFIINLKGRKLTKDALAVLSILPIAFIIITITFMFKYKPVYRVTLAGRLLGYVDNQEEIEKKVNEYKNYSGGNIAFITMDVMPEYEKKYVSKNKVTEEERVLDEIKSTADIMYKSYAITLDGETKSVVENLKEAEELVNEIKQELKADLELDLGIIEIYNDNLDDIQDYEIAKENVNEEVETKVKEFELSQKQESILNGIALYKPMETGIISSRYGTRSSGNHTGLDIATSTGTPIYPIAEGIVTKATYSGGYGNLVVIDHGNNIESYYAHCSAIYVNVGDKVTPSDIISAVGSTGNSTGPHLHLEIRINGEDVDPQLYVYK